MANRRFQQVDVFTATPTSLLKVGVIGLHPAGSDVAVGGGTHTVVDGAIDL